MNESMTKDEIINKCRMEDDVEIEYEFTLKTMDGDWPNYRYPPYLIGKDRIMLWLIDNIDIMYDYLTFHANIPEETLDRWSDDYLNYVYDNFDDLLKGYLYGFVYDAFEDDAKEDCKHYFTYEYRRRRSGLESFGN